MKRVVVLLLLAVLLTAVVGEGVDARRRHRVRATTEIVDVTHENENTDTGTIVSSISGGLFSRRPKCVAGRTVEVAQSSNGTPYGVATSDVKGDWRIEGEGPGQNTSYTIRVAGVTIHRVRCSKAEFVYIAD